MDGVGIARYLTLLESMSLESFLGLLRTADQIDRESVPMRRPVLLRSGVTLSIVGVLVAIIAYAASSGCVSVAFLLLASVGLILLLAYALEAKLYGRIAVALVFLFFGSCFAIPVLLQPRPSEAEMVSAAPEQSTVTAPVTLSGHGSNPPGELVLPPKPTVPRILETKVPRLPQVYADQTRGSYTARPVRFGPLECSAWLVPWHDHRATVLTARAPRSSQSRTT
jgi:hypothetical protein